jgi:Na+/proline symporter
LVGAIFDLGFHFRLWGLQNSRQKKFRDLPQREYDNWWTIGLSIMATQASAITFLSTPGQAYEDGMRFIQFYFGLPLAMIIISIAFVPIYYKLKVYTAYEYLESSFDLKTRTLTALLFIVQRGLAAGITIYAPAIILVYVARLEFDTGRTFSLVCWSLHIPFLGEQRQYRLPKSNKWL